MDRSGKFMGFILIGVLLIAILAIYSIVSVKIEPFNWMYFDKTYNIALITIKGKTENTGETEEITEWLKCEGYSLYDVTVRKAWCFQSYKFERLEDIYNIKKMYFPKYFKDGFAEINGGLIAFGKQGFDNIAVYGISADYGDEVFIPLIGGYLAKNDIYGDGYHIFEGDYNKPNYAVLDKYPDAKVLEAGLHEEKLDEYFEKLNSIIEKARKRYEKIVKRGWMFRWELPS